MPKRQIISQWLGLHLQLLALVQKHFTPLSRHDHSINKGNINATPDAKHDRWSVILVLLTNFYHDSPGVSQHETLARV